MAIVPSLFRSTTLLLVLLKIFLSFIAVPENEEHNIIVNNLSSKLQPLNFVLSSNNNLHSQTNFDDRQRNKFFHSLTSEGDSESGYSLEIEITFSETQVKCNGLNTGALSVTVDGGKPPYTFQWTGPNFSSTNDQINNLYAGTYEITVTDDDGHTGSSSLILEEPEALTMELAGSTPVTCSGGSDGTITAGTASGGNGDYSYSLDGVNFQSSSHFKGLSAGSYTITVKDAKDCTVTDFIEITQPQVLSIEPGAYASVSCNGGSDGSITAGSVSGGNTGYSYSIDGFNFQSSNHFTGLSAGSYTITVKDSKGCTDTDVIVVTEPQALSMETGDSTPVNCNGGSNGTITAGNVSGGNAGYSYSIDGINFQSSNHFPGLSAGSYTITIKDSKGCTDTDVIVVTEPQALSMETGNSTTVSCNGESDGTITAGNVSGGNAGYSYSIDGINFQSSNHFPGLSAGSYTIIVKDSKGCTDTDVIVVTEPRALSMETGNSTPVNCNGGSDGTITAGNVSGGNAGYSYSLDGTNFQESNHFTGLSADNYTITVKDAKGCEETGFIEVTQPQALIMQPAESFPVTCNGGDDGSINVGTVSGGTGDYRYSVNGSEFIPQKSYSGLVKGDYVVTVRDESGCEYSETVSITEPEELSMVTPVSTDVTCFGGNDGSISAGEVSGGVSPYSYSIDNIQFQDHREFTGVPGGRHSIFVIDANGCAYESQIDVGEPEALTASIHIRDVSCHGESTGEVTLTNLSGGSGNYEFSADGEIWHSGNATINNLPAGNHDILLRDANITSCFRTIGNVSIAQPEPISGEVTTTRTSTYGTATGKASVSAAGGSSRYIFEWRIAGEDEVIRNTQSASNLAAGDYIVTVIDAEAPDCSLAIPFEIIDNIRASILPGSNCESIEDIIRTSRFQVEMDSIAGGVGSPMDFTYDWHFGEGVTSIERIASNNQIETLSPTQNKYVGAIDDSFKVKYSAAGDRTITLWITDKTEPEPVTTQITFDHYVGECFETCGASQDFIIDPDSFYIGDKDGIPVDGKDCDNSTEKYLWLTILKSSTAHALNVELMYSVNDGETTYSRKALNCFGEKITSGNKEGEWTQIIVEDEPLKYKLFQIVSGSDSQSEINWSCGQTFNIEGLNLRWVTNSKWDCDNSTNKSCLSLPTDVDVSTPIIATATAENILCNGDSTGSIIISTSGGVRPFYYSITGDEETHYVESRQFFDLPAGEYPNIWVKDGRGAKFHIEDTIRITEPGPLVIDRIEKKEPECYGDTGEITICVSGGTPFVGEEYEYKYLWNDIDKQDTKTAEGLPEGTYTVTIIDANGCQIIESITITEPEALSPAEAGESQSIGCGFFSTFLDANSATIGFGKWSVTAYPDNVASEDIIIEDPESPTSKFSAPEGSYTLRWTIANEDGTCSNYSETIIEFEGDCENLDFDGVDDYIYVGDHYNFPSTEFTLEAWIKPESINGNRTIVSKGDWRSPSAGGYEMLINNGAPTFRWNGTSVTSSHKVSTTRWYHISVVFTSDRVDIYVDGIGVGNRTVASFPGVTSQPFLIGGMYDSSNPEKPQSLFHGWLEELRIWNTRLTLDQVRFMMNQRIEPATTADNSNVVKGEMLPMNVPGPLSWGSLKGYFRLMANINQIENGTTPNLAPDSPEGFLKNIQSFQRNSAPLPYISEVDGKWNERATWDQNIGEGNEKWWEYPNAVGINGTSIDWNIAYVDKSLLSGERDITLLALLLSDTLEMEGVNPERINSTIIPGSGNGLTVTHYLKLKGKIDLNGESQLVQTEGSILEGSGTLERDQQGTASSYNYNYWTSPVSTAGNGQNSGYTMEEVLRDGSDPNDPKEIDFNYQYHYADGAKTDPIRISTYWLNKFFGTANQYSQWRHVGHTGKLKAGEGVSMKGSSGNSEIKDLQNYIFTGIPNNGTIELAIGENQNYLVGNPYPSALDADEFIRDNLANRRNGQNIFNGTLYFWDHFSGKSHYLEEYIGGYAIFNLSGGVRAISNDERINNDTTNGEYKEGEKIPQRFIPVGQAFFLSTKLDEAIESSEIPANVDGGNIRFRNSQRVFVKENADSSVFHSQEPTQKREKEKIENRSQIWLKFDSPTGYHRQLLVTADQEATNGFDIGYDAILIENNAEDMYWYFNEVEFIIQGVPHFNREQVLPLGIKIKKHSEFTIRIDDLKNVPEEMEIYLKDKLKNVVHDLRTGDYTSISDPGTINDRFQLIFQNQDSEPGEGEGESEGEDGGEGDGDESGNENSGEGEELIPKGLELFYVRDTKEIIIRNPQLVKIYNTILSNALGQQVKDYGDTPEIKETKLPVNDLGTGVYLISVVTENGTLIHKIIIE